MGINWNKIELEQLYQEGATLADLGQRYRVTTKRIRQVLQAFGIIKQEHRIIHSWSRVELEALYNQGYSLDQIGEKYKVTGERIRQVMEELNIIRRRGGTQLGCRHKNKQIYRTLDDYLAAHPVDHPDSKAVRQYLPDNICCADCGTKEELEIHHLTYPALSSGDILILCPSCHMSRHRKMPFRSQISLWNDRVINQVGIKELAKKYGVGIYTVYLILRKFRGVPLYKKHHHRAKSNFPLHFS
jgi:Mor family transcriptional regulator